VGMIKYTTNKKINPLFVQDLINSMGWEMRVVEDIRLSLDNSYRVVFAWDGTLLVGFGRVVSDGVYMAGIWDLVVRPKYQGRYIGSAILRRLVQFLQVKGFDMVTLFAAPGEDGFYHKHGFTRNCEGIIGLMLPVDQSCPG
jgi:predicted N-acetyltransferase YhbS